MPQSKINKNISEQRFLLSGVTWQQYESLRQTLAEFSTTKITYLDHILEIMTPSPEHETTKATIGLLLDTYLQKQGIRFYKGGSPTLKNQTTMRGKEPDECYCLNTKKDIPEIAIEVILTSGGLDILSVYQGLGVSEVWFFQEGELTVYSLKNNQYQKLSNSELLPSLDLKLMTRYLNYSDQFDAFTEWRDTIG